MNICHWLQQLIHGYSSKMLLCLVRDAAAKLPWNIGTREDIGTLLRNSQYICGPRISAHALPLDGELNFYLKNDFYLLRKWLGVATYFCFIFKRVNKIRKKTLSATPYFGKGDLRKTGSGSGVKLLTRKVR